MEEIKNEGQIIYFWHSKDHCPPHFHAKHKQGEWEIRVFFIECTDHLLSYDYKFPPSYTQKLHPIKATFRKQILKQLSALTKTIFGDDGKPVVVSFQAALYKEWDRKVKLDNTFKH